MTVAVPGGDLVVELSPSGLGETSLAVRLGGPVAHVFDVDVDRYTLDSAANHLEHRLHHLVR